MSVSVARGRDNNTQGAPYASVSYGPLLFALPIADTQGPNTPDPTAGFDAYVGGDNTVFGHNWAQYLVDKASGTGNPLYLYAGAASDNNAFLFFEGAWNVLQPKIADGTFVIKNSDKAVGLQGNATLTRDQETSIIGQINDIKTRLASINPNSLSDVEKLALKGALAVVT